MNDLSELRRRVQEAKGADRELDLAIYQHLRATATELASGKSAAPIPNYTASVDSALALIERVMPGWCWSVHSNHGGAMAMLCRDWDDDYAKVFWSEPRAPKPRISFERRPGSKPPALALLAALLSALEAQNG